MHTEPSLTLDTLSSVLDGVQHMYDLDDIGTWLQIPGFKRDEIERQYDWRQLPRAYSTVFLTDNPSPSWSTVAYALWEAGEHGALEVVQKLYLKGQPCVRVRDELVAFSYIVNLLLMCGAWHWTNIQKALFMTLVDHAILHVQCHVHPSILYLYNYPLFCGCA